jgi:tetratricopeptide (TPR) repeat protein
MTRIAWKAFPHPSPDYELTVDALRRRWARLHEGDCELFPSAANLRKVVARHPGLDGAISIEQAAERLQRAWQAYHGGEFGNAVELGRAIGPLGANVANKATCIYATYLETAEKRRLALFLEAAKHAEELQELAPSLPNAWYLHALALGRYAQGISIVAALAQGLGGRVMGSLEQAIALEPRHADAHIALGAYHAEVIGKVGGFIGGLTYGASAKDAVTHFEKALELNPHSAIAHLEYADGLLLVFGQSKLAEARRHYHDAAKMRPADAMERLDVERAAAGIED